MNHLHALMRDQRYWDKKHPEHVSYVRGVTKAFEDAFGTGKPAHDATGRLLPASDLLALRRRVSAQPGTQGGAPQQRIRSDGSIVTGSERDGRRIILPDGTPLRIGPNVFGDEGKIRQDAGPENRSKIESDIIGFFRLITGISNRMKDKEKKSPPRDKRGGTRW